MKSKLSVLVGIGILAGSLFAARPVARWDVVPHQRVTGVFKAGVVAFHEKGVKVADTNADNNVRHQNDMTVPLHGPWLSLPSENTMTVTWITRVKCAAGIRYWEKGTTNAIERWNVKCGMPEYTKTIHAFHLSGLKPGTDYEYRLLSNMDRYMSPYSAVLSEGR